MTSSSAAAPEKKPTGDRWGVWRGSCPKLTPLKKLSGGAESFFIERLLRKVISEFWMQVSY